MMARASQQRRLDGRCILGCVLIGVSLFGCASLPPARICATVPTGTTGTTATFVAVPAGWCSADGKEHMPAVDNVGIALAAKLSYLTYQTDDQINALGAVTIGEVGPDPQGEFPRLFGTRYFIWHDASGATAREYLAIRGTANFENIFEDANYPKIFDPVLNIYVHRGYYQIATEILDRLHQLKLPGADPVWVTGHSLGGGVALLVYLHLNHEGATLGPLYTFGQPRTVAVDAWEPYRCLPIVRVVNYGDFVPLVPPTVKDQGCDRPLDPGCHGSFIQVGDELLLTGDGNCQYRTYHDPNAIGYDVVRTLLEDAQHHELKKYLLVHMQDAYLANTRPLADNPGLSCVYHPRPLRASPTFRPR
jgi:hypothetical protein